MRWFKPNTHLTRELTIAPPAPAPDRHGIAIVACVKNEADYLEEWIRFHTAVGVRHFVLYDDGSSDGTADLARSLLGPEQLTVVPWISRMFDAESDTILNGQTIAFAHAILNFGGRFARVAFIDVDEFLLPKTGTTLEQALTATENFPNISLPWHMFGPGGHDSKPEGPIALNYTLRARDPLSRAANLSNFKCIVDPCEVVQVSVHQFRTRGHGDLTVNDAGQKTTRSGRKQPDFYSSQFLQLNHYYSKSRAELSAKIARGWSSDATRAKYQAKVLQTVAHIEADLVEDRAMLAFLAENGIVLAG